jgi:hypothetical protein
MTDDDPTVAVPAAANRLEPDPPPPPSRPRSPPARAWSPVRPAAATLRLYARDWSALAAQAGPVTAKLRRFGHRDKMPRSRASEGLPARDSGENKTYF